MALIFYSSRKGYDEPAVLIQEPRVDPDDVQKKPATKPLSFVPRAESM
jgi:hypothetical protein